MSRVGTMKIVTAAPSRWLRERDRPCGQIDIREIGPCLPVRTHHLSIGPGVGECLLLAPAHPPQDAGSGPVGKHDPRCLS
jgi:hypothetical protein